VGFNFYHYLFGGGFRGSGGLQLLGGPISQTRVGLRLASWQQKFRPKWLRQKCQCHTPLGGFVQLLISLPWALTPRRWLCQWVCNAWPDPHWPSSRKRRHRPLPCTELYCLAIGAVDGCEQHCAGAHRPGVEPTTLWCGLQSAASPPSHAVRGTTRDHWQTVKRMVKVSSGQRTLIC